ncbi:hypothetical protein [Methylobacterium nigriterrae]|uniref:hypothetical protein n=1 Tax=Methylobacterium nigriterrae TaxID=3127512 RepID=UPI003013CDC5
MRQTIIKYSPPSDTFDKCHRFLIDGPDARQVNDWFLLQGFGRFEDGQLRGDEDDFAFISLPAAEFGELLKLRDLSRSHPQVRDMGFDLLR